MTPEEQVHEINSQSPRFLRHFLSTFKSLQINFDAKMDGNS